MAQYDRTILSSSDSSPPELSTPSPTGDLLGPSTSSNNVPLSSFVQQKFSIHHQDAEASIADTTDCLRMIKGKMEWFYRKQQFCPHLVSTDDAQQIAKLHRRILIEEIPFLELQERLLNGMVVDIPKELEGKISTVCKMFHELKTRIDNLITHVALASPPQTPKPSVANTSPVDKKIIEAVQ